MPRSIDPSEGLACPKRYADGLTKDQIDDVVLWGIASHAWLWEHHETSDLAGREDAPGQLSSLHFADGTGLTDEALSGLELANQILIYVTDHLED